MENESIFLLITKLSMLIILFCVELIFGSV